MKFIIIVIIILMINNINKINCLNHNNNNSNQDQYKCQYQNNHYNIINEYPIIGILSQPSSSDKFKEYGSQYIAASYVKYLESAGARVVPILYDQDENELIKLFNSINGILLPGGGVYFDQEPIYNKTLYTIWDYVIKSNDRGDYFALWGTCLGFEEIVSVAANSYQVLTSFNASNYSIPLNLTQDVFNYKNNQLFKYLDGEMLKIVSNEPITMNNHRWGLSVETFKSYSSLYQFFNILALNNDKDGKTFISVIEAKEYPIFAVIFHPEKPQFEWYIKEDINHSSNSIKFSQYLSNFFVNESKKSSHRFKDLDIEYNTLIYNYTPRRYNNIKSYQQLYFFNQSSSTIKTTTTTTTTTTTSSKL